ncbi:hypothetical protein BDY19DRAFT_938224 [Irpex rosettiformis]|uniref:Uncharacterized protein n=1 Tax=Irpex rosettiformis TaxID=378272 RepID=A0ACB8U773_9APHY|nr:hypothetical protein BDY19DRAFT_938224 [Irpex rosettiformis]
MPLALQYIQPQSENTDEGYVKRSRPSLDSMASSSEVDLDDTITQSDPPVPVGATSLHAQDASDATGLGQQPYHHPTLCANLPHESWSPASTRLPCKLFDNILFYLWIDYNLSRLRGDPVHRQVMRCSLVCLHWANWWRRWLFKGIDLEIRSFEEAQTLVKYAAQGLGCPALIPVHKLIRSIRVKQNYDGRRSFCDRVYMLKATLGVRLSTLTLNGPVPDGFPLCKLDTPHWTLPPSVPTPPSLLSYEEITVKDIHFPSLRHVKKYVKHFAQADSVYFDGITWDAGGREFSLDFHRRGARKIKNSSLTVVAVGCTNNISLCLLAATAHSCWQFLMYTLPDNESQWMATIVRWLRESADRNQPYWLEIKGLKDSKPPIRIISTGFSMNWSLQFHFYDLAAEDSHDSDVHLVGVSWYMGEEETFIDLDSLRAHVRQFPMLHVVLLNFGSYEGLLAATGCHRPLSFDPHPPIGQGCKYVFTCIPNSDDEFPEVPRAKNDYYCIEIDPITLSPTGRSWAYNSDFNLELLLIRESLRQTGKILSASI